MRAVGRACTIGRRSHQLEVVLNQHPVEKHGHARRALERAVGLEVRPVEDDVVRLPVAGRSRGVDERGILAVDGAGLAIGIRVVLVGVEDLELVHPHQKDPAVPALLALALHDSRRCPFDVELHIPERTRGYQHPGSRLHFDVAVLDDPLGRRAVLGAPLRQVRPVEQDDRILRRANGRPLGAGIDDRRTRAVHRVLRPLLCLRHEQQS